MSDSSPSGVRAPGRRPTDVLLDQPAGDHRREQRLARSDRAHRLDQPRRRCALEQEPGGARLERLVDGLVAVEGREDEDLRRRPARNDTPGRLEPVEPRHPDVHQHDVGLELAHDPERLLTVLGLTDDLDVLLRLEDHPEPGADQRLVVDDQHADHDGAPSGRLARTRKPPVGCGAASSEPPKTLTRSRIPTRPSPLPVPSALPSPSSTTSTTSRSSSRTDVNAGARDTRVLARVGQRLLDDAVHRELDAGGQWRIELLDGELHREPRRARLGDERLQLAEPGLGHEADLLSCLAKHAEQQPHLGERPASRVLDRANRLQRPLGIGAQYLLGGAGLDDHHSERVGDHVVQLAGDAAALGLDREARLLLPFLLENLGAALEPLRLLDPHPHEPAYEQRSTGRHRPEGEVVEPLVLARHRYGVGDGDDGEPREHAVERRVRGERVGGDDDRDERCERLLNRNAGDDLEAPGRADHGERSEGVDPAPGERTRRRPGRRESTPSTA